MYSFPIIRVSRRRTVDPRPAVAVKINGLGDEKELLFFLYKTSNSPNIVQDPVPSPIIDFKLPKSREERLQELFGNRLDVVYDFYKVVLGHINDINFDLQDWRMRFATVEDVMQEFQSSDSSEEEETADEDEYVEDWQDDYGEEDEFEEDPDDTESEGEWFDSSDGEEKFDEEELLRLQMHRVRLFSNDSSGATSYDSSDISSDASSDDSMVQNRDDEEYYYLG